MNKITISKPIVPDDVPQIQEVVVSTWISTYTNKELGITEEDSIEFTKSWTSPERIQKRIEELLAIPPNKLFLVAKDRDRVVGMCVGVIEKEFNQLKSIYILPEYQGMGIGKMFWNELLTFFERGKDVMVELATYNLKTIEFYKKLGFVDKGKRFTDERHRMPISGVLMPLMEMWLKLG